MAVNIMVREADLYIIVPLHILDYKAFEKGLLAAGWVRPESVRFDLYSPDSLYETAASFLGMTKTGHSQGDCFLAPEKKDVSTTLGKFREAFNGKTCNMTLSNKKRDEADPVWMDEIMLGDILRIHISPDKSIALFLIHFRRPQFKNGAPTKPISIESVESTNYWLHMATNGLAPSIFIDGTNIMGCKTITDIVALLAGLAPKVADFVSPKHLLSATYLQITVPEMSMQKKEEFDKEVDNRILHIAQSKGPAFEIVETDTLKTHHLFENIRISVSSEGFCGGFLVNEGEMNEKYTSKSSTSFLKSYLPVFLETVMLDYMSLRMLDRIGEKDYKEQTTLFGELNMKMLMPISRFSHLQQLKRIMIPIYSVPEKIKTVSAYLANQQKEVSLRGTT